MRFALGCVDCEDGQQLIDRLPSTLEETIKRVKTSQLSRCAIARRQRAVRPSSHDRSASNEVSLKSFTRVRFKGATKR